MGFFFLCDCRIEHVQTQMKAQSHYESAECLKEMVYELVVHKLVLGNDSTEGVVLVTCLSEEELDNTQPFEIHLPIKLWRCCGEIHNAESQI